MYNCQTWSSQPADPFSLFYSKSKHRKIKQKATTAQDEKDRGCSKNINLRHNYASSFSQISHNFSYPAAASTVVASARNNTNSVNTSITQPHQQHSRSHQQWYNSPGPPAINAPSCSTEFTAEYPLLFIATHTEPSSLSVRFSVLRCALYGSSS